MTLKRNNMGLAVLLAFAGAVLGAEPSLWDQPTEPLAKPTEITVYRSPSCGCCGKWLDHMKQHGFSIKDVKDNDMDGIKRKLGVPASLHSCHTGVVDGYLIEGHVPAKDVKNLLKTKPDLAGLAVPGMPVGPPGMVMGSRKDPFAVLGFTKDGRSSVFSDYSSY
jgi:hypothetical protein